MTALLPIRHPDDVRPAYRRTPVGDLIPYHNLRSPHRSYDQAEIPIGMCVDSRIPLPIPNHFAHILRAGGGHLQRPEFVSYAVAIGGVRTICLIGRDQYGMVGLRARRDVFANGLVENGGWARRGAEQHFDQFSAIFEIGDPAAFALSEARRLRKRYPRVMVAPFIYRVRDGLLYPIAEDEASGVVDGH